MKCLKTLQVLFDNRIPYIFFVDEKISNDSILNYFSTHELDNFDDSFFKSNDLFISFQSNSNRTLKKDS